MNAFSHQSSIKQQQTDRVVLGATGAVIFSGIALLGCNHFDIGSKVSNFAQKFSPPQAVKSIENSLHTVVPIPDLGHFETTNSQVK